MSRIALHDTESERALLGALLIDPRRLAEVEHLGAEDFYAPPHQAIWTAMQALAGQPFDTVAVRAQLGARGMLTDQVGAALLEAEETALSAAGLQVYARAILDRSLRRRLAAAGEKIQRLAMQPADSAAELLDAAEREIFALAEGAVRGAKRDPVDSRTVVREAVARVSELRKAGGMPGLTFGLETLDRKTSGLNAGELWVLAARPGIGKSALALNVALAAAKSGKASSLIHSLEMQRVELGLRAICGEAQVPLERIRGGRLSQVDMDQFTQGAAKVHNLPIWWDDDASVTILDLRAKARRIKQLDPKLGLIVVDYIQLARPTGKQTQRHLEVAEVTRGLKELAKELGVAILALSQLSRDVEKANRRPKPSDLRESGSIEADADAIVFIHRDDDSPPQGPGGALGCELIIAKQRNGDRGVVIPVTYQAKWTTFEDGQSGLASVEVPPAEDQPRRQFQDRYRKRGMR